MVALEQESWQVDDYLPIKTTSKLKENQINVGLVILIHMGLDSSCTYVTFVMLHYSITLHSTNILLRGPRHRWIKYFPQLSFMLNVTSMDFIYYPIQNSIFLVFII